MSNINDTLQYDQQFVRDAISNITWVMSIPSKNYKFAIVHIPQFSSQDLYCVGSLNDQSLIPTVTHEIMKGKQICKKFNIKKKQLQKQYRMFTIQNNTIVDVQNSEYYQFRHPLIFKSQFCRIIKNQNQETQCTMI